MTMVVEPAAVGGLPAARSWRVRWPTDSTIGTLATVLWSVLSLLRQYTVRTGVDLGIYTQAVSRYAHGQLPWSYVKGGGGFNLLGDHFTPVIAVIAPL